MGRTIRNALIKSIKQLLPYSSSSIVNIHHGASLFVEQNLLPFYKTEDIITNESNTNLKKKQKKQKKETTLVSVNSYFSSLVNLVLVSTAIDRDTSGSLVRVRDGR